MTQATHGRDFVGAARAGTRNGLRVAYCPDVAGIGVDASIEATCRQAAFDLAAAGVHVEEIALDLRGYRDAFLALRGEWFVAYLFDKLEHLERLGVNVRGNIEAGLAMDPRTVAAAHHARGQLWHRFRELFENVDCLLTPTMAVPPFPVEQNYPAEVAGRTMQTYVDWIAPTFLLSLTGLPVASVPCGLDVRGLPVGLQVAGRPNHEELVLGLSAEIQRQHPVALP